MSDFVFDGPVTVDTVLSVLKTRNLSPKVRPVLSESSYVISGQTKPVSGPDLLKAISKAKLSAREAETVLGLPRNTLIRKAADLGTPFNSNGTKRARAGTSGNFNAYTGLGKPAGKPPVNPTGRPPVTPTGKPTEEAPVVEAVVPDTAKPLTDVPDGGCEQYVGTRDGKPVYCARPGKSVQRRDGPIVRCDTHRFG